MDLAAIDELPDDWDTPLDDSSEDNTDALFLWRCVDHTMNLAICDCFGQHAQHQESRQLIQQVPFQFQLSQHFIQLRIDGLGA